MTAQIHDKILITEKVFSIVGYTGGDFFTPQSVGIVLFPVITSCGRGYVCQYQARDNKLILDELLVSIKKDSMPGRVQPFALQEGPSINGVRPAGKHPIFNSTYEGLNLEIPFTGSILAVDGFIQNLYVHIGFHPAWKYETVLEVSLERGNVQEIRDVSVEMEQVRSKRTDPSKRGVPGRIRAELPHVN